MEYGALIPCLLASVIGDWACQAWGIHHSLFRIAYLADVTGPIALDPSLLAKAAVAGIAFGLVALVFAEANHLLGGWLKRLIPYGPLRPVLGGMAVIGLVYALGTRDYLGLGVTAPDPGGLSIASFFGLEVHPWSWAWKILFTVVTLASGFKGGEVTPLFFIGAALGNALGGLMGAPLDLMAALGFVAVFAGAANTPLACTLMGIELFGGDARRRHRGRVLHRLCLFGPSRHLPVAAHRRLQGWGRRGRGHPARRTDPALKQGEAQGISRPVLGSCRDEGGLPCRTPVRAAARRRARLAQCDVA